LCSQALRIALRCYIQPQKKRKKGKEFFSFLGLKTQLKGNKNSNTFGMVLKRKKKNEGFHKLFLLPFA
jgi:hypothetical protein